VKHRFRRGWTTGTCAAAAALGAVALLYTGELPDPLRVSTPGGEEAVLHPAGPQRGAGWARVLVGKDGGDDPDATHGLLIGVEARIAGDPGVRLAGGEGVGVVTRPGLPVPVGEPAINPVPRQMIEAAARQFLPPGAGVELTVFVPGGAEVARRTGNAKLGIVGGISILGTTGVVEPMSEEAFKTSLVPQVDVARAAGITTLVLVPGRSGERHARERGFPEATVVEVSNFWGYMLQAAAEREMRAVLLLGHQGKLVKLAGGIFHTHSRVADARAEILAAHAAAAGASRELVRRLLECPSAEEAALLLRETMMDRTVFAAVASRASRRAAEHVEGRLAVGTALLDLGGNLLGCDPTARRLAAVLGGSLAVHAPRRDGGSGAAPV
jgi:cobalt-precorrin-5B (C1)-methyltransferase